MYSLDERSSVKEWLKLFQDKPWGMFYLHGIAVVLSGIEDLELLIHSFNFSLHIYLKVYCMLGSILVTRDTAVIKIDMVPSHM